MGLRLSAAVLIVVCLATISVAELPTPEARAATPTTTWTQQSPAHSPPGRDVASMAYDPGTGQLVLFGGVNTSSSGFLNDTWTWNGTTWTQQSPTTSPPASDDSSMAYDSGTGQLVLFGGFYSGCGLGCGIFSNQTWTWNGTTWTQQSPTTSPPVRAGSSMAYDSGTGQLVLFGGEDGSSGFLNDTWTWNGTTWTQQSPTTSPPARVRASAAYDTSTGQLVLFGGYDNSNAVLGDTWTWNGTTWTQLYPAASPPARWLASMSYDPGTGQQLVLFGGESSSSSFLNDTWTWDGTTWTQQSPTTSPAARWFASMDYDSGSGQLVLFGGFGGLDFNDTWTYGYPLATAVIIPSNGADLSGTSALLDATASAGAGVATVQFVLTGGSFNKSVIGTATPTIYGYLSGWNTTNVPGGTYTMQSLVTDDNGNTAYSPGIMITVDNTPPTTAVIVPSNGAHLKGIAVLDASASASYGVKITKVQFVLTGRSFNKSVIGTATHTIYGWLFVGDSTHVPNGTYSLQSLATDAAGNTAYSAGITIKVAN